MRFPLVPQLVGWLLVGCVMYAFELASTHGELGQLHLLYDGGSLALGGLAVSSGLLWLYRRIGVPGRTPRLVAGAVAGSLVGALVWYALLHTVDSLVVVDTLEIPFELTWWDLAGDLVLFVFMMSAWHAAALAVRATYRAAHAERLAQQARLEALQYQLNPHFLFNALNSAVAMIDEDPARAQRMLTLLSALLRHTLRRDAGTSTLGEELDVIARYLEIEGVRFEDKLAVSVDVPDALRTCSVPPLLLHALVENAVKHGMQTSPMPLRVSLAARRDGDMLAIEVRNTGRLERGEGGIGLRNIAGRLDAMFPGRHRFGLDEDDGWVRAVLSVPAVETR
jgi:hypothetical protein